MHLQDGCGLVAVNDFNLFPDIDVPENGHHDPDPVWVGALAEQYSGR